jgi:hypothetical protein
MAFYGFLDAISTEFSGKEFTTEDLLAFLTKKEQKKKPKVKGEKKKQRLTVRSYIMTEETDKYKVRVTERVEQNKEGNKSKVEHLNTELLNLTTDDENYEQVKESLKKQIKEVKKNENFMIVLSEIMSEMSEEELDEIREKVDAYNKKHFPEETSSDSE